MIKQFALFFLATHLLAAPWTLDPATEERTQALIEEKHQQRLAEVEEGQGYYAIDFVRVKLNYPSPIEGDELQAKLEAAGFQRIPQWHCVGITLFFINYVLDNPQILSLSCADLLSNVSSDPHFLPLSHSLSINQPYYYYPPEEENILQLNAEKMKQYFYVVIGKSPETYYVYSSPNPAYFNPVAIYTTLQQFPEKLLMVMYKNPVGFYHCIAVSTLSKKYFIFDSESGLFAFPNLETLSWKAGTVLQNSQFYWLAAFSSGVP